MLRISGLKAQVHGKDVLRGVDLQVDGGTVHAIMGPNGSGKSSLAHVLAGRDGYAATAGNAWLDEVDLLALAPEERARAGLFLGLQYPVEIPGVSNLQFLKVALNAQRRARGEPELDAVAFMKHARAQADRVQLDHRFLKRGVNEGFSGGEKKRNEIFQMAMLEPRVAVLDETDSGLDIDALRTVAEGVNGLRAPGRAIVLITHYQRLLQYIRPDVVHVFAEGRVLRSGGPELAGQLEAQGYAGFVAAGAAAAVGETAAPSTGAA